MTSDPDMSAARAQADEEQAGYGRIVQKVVVVTCVLLAILTMAFQGSSVDQQLKQIGSTHSDGVKRSLGDFMSSYRKFELALLRIDGNGVEPARQALMSLRSQIESYKSSEDYSSHRDVKSFDLALTEADLFSRQMLSELAVNELPEPLIRDLADRALSAEDAMRELQETGLDIAYARTRETRAEVSSTFIRLSGFATILLMALLMLTLYLSWQGRLVLTRARRESQTTTRLEAILASSKDGVVVTDSIGRIKTFGTSAVEIFDEAPESAEGKMFSDLLGVSREKLCDLQGHCRKTVCEIKVTTPSGKTFPAEISSRSATASGEEITVFFVRNISHRKAIEQELIAARDKALAGQEAKASFVAVMSHEIRTPLNGIIGIIDLLSDTDLGQEQRRLLGNLEVSSRILLSHLNNVLDISRSDAGSLKLATRPADIARVIRDVIQSQSDVASQKGNMLLGDVIGDGELTYMIDPDRLRQVLINLVNNAQKFTESGEIRIEVERLSEGEKTDAVEIRISDTGVGIPDDKIGKIFDDFETLDTSYARNQSGAGLGLGIVRRLVAAMGGRIDVDSEEGCGTQFTILLHLEQVLPTEVDDEHREDPMMHQPIIRSNVLIVEDNDINRDVLRRLVEKIGARVDVAENGRTAVEMARRTRYDLIFMDISMPVMDGVEATRQIREEGASRDSDIVATTADLSFVERPEYRSTGFSGMVSKPIPRSMLHHLLKQPDLPEAEAAGGRGVRKGSALDRAVAVGMRDDLGAKALRGIIDRLLREGEDLVIWLDQANVPEDIANRAHALAGAAGTCGAQALYRILRKIEEKAREDKILPSRSELAHARETLERTRQEMEEIGIATCEGEA